MKTVEVSQSALESLQKMVEQLQGERDELLEAFSYWLPDHEPLRDQVDAPSIEHRRKWFYAKFLIAKCTAKPEVLE